MVASERDRQTREDRESEVNRVGWGAGAAQLQPAGRNTVRVFRKNFTFCDAEKKNKKIKNNKKNNLPVCPTACLFFLVFYTIGGNHGYYK